MRITVLTTTDTATGFRLDTMTQEYRGMCFFLDTPSGYKALPQMLSISASGALSAAPMRLPDLIDQPA